MNDPDRIYEALDGARRAGWAKFYESQQDIERLTYRVETLESFVVMSLAYWIDQAGRHGLYWSNIDSLGLRSTAIEYLERNSKWGGEQPDGSVSPFPQIAQRILDARHD